jgi:(1->4)-alpha-D-glucan 1-alpha-D-glucosylmutase
MVKSEREAGLRTSWTEQVTSHEELVDRFARELVTGPVRYAVEEFGRSLDGPAEANSLGATLVQLTMPGVPDVYQGDEETQYLLVDPANRAPYRPRPADGVLSAKHLITKAALRLRQELPGCFGPGGSYQPLAARGKAAGHCLAFVRGGRALTVATRLSRRLADTGGWHDTVLPLPEGAWTDLLTGAKAAGEAPLAKLLDSRPVALLVR